MIALTLDKPRNLRFGPMATQLRLAELPNPPSLSELGASGPKGIAAMIAIVWACIDRPHPFETPEKLAEFLDANPTAASEVLEKLPTLLEGGTKNGQGSTSGGSPASSLGSQTASSQKSNTPISPPSFAHTNDAKNDGTDASD